MTQRGRADATRPADSFRPRQILRKPCGQVKDTSNKVADKFDGDITDW